MTSSVPAAVNQASGKPPQQLPTPTNTGAVIPVAGKGSPQWTGGASGLSGLAGQLREAAKRFCNGETPRLGKDKPAFDPAGLKETVANTPSAVEYMANKLKATIPLKPSPTALEWNGDGSTYDGESDVSVIARMLYGEDPSSIEAHLWMLFHRRLQNTLIGYGKYSYYESNTYRGLVLGEGQFDSMSSQGGNMKSLDPASYIDSPEGKKQWYKSVDMAYDLMNKGTGSIEYPKDFKREFTFTHSLEDERIDIRYWYPNGKEYGGTWFNDDVRRDP
jgi:hypothetical protein